MTITLDIKPETEAALARQASARGLAVDAYVTRLLEDATAHLSTSTGTEDTDLVELFAPVRNLFKDGELDFSRNSSTGRSVDFS